MPTIGLNLDDDLADALDVEKRRRDEQTDRSVSRSEVAREWLRLGQIASEILADENIEPGHAREAQLRQALYDHFRESS